MRTSTISARFFALALMAIPPALLAEDQPPSTPPVSVATLRSWVQEMKQLPRGPFTRVRWFCKDGQVLDPQPFACEKHGGGVQHGEWTDKTKAVREAGYPIANVLADLKPEDVIGPKADPQFLRIILLEKFLIAFDDGWILRNAQFLRGAFQDFNENDSGKAILLAMLGDPAWKQRFVVLREAVRLLPHGAESALLTEVRGMATTIAEKDPPFDTLRAKIHLAPDARDAQRVREYSVSKKAKVELKEDYEHLAATIDEAYISKALPPMLHSLAKKVKKPELSSQIETIAIELESKSDPENQFRLSSNFLILIREHLLELGLPSIRLVALDASLNAEITAFTASRALLQTMPQASRAQRFVWMGMAARAVYGLGLFTSRELAEIELSLQHLPAQPVRLDVYRNELLELERPAGWAGRRLKYHFGNAIDRLLPIEPLADMYIPDRLRSSAMLFYSSVLESLSEDADRLGNTRHSIFGQETSTGLRRLNPGLARGVLRTTEDRIPADASAAPAIYLVPETVADLPPVAGILTTDEGNALSHVQLLARNLGIPNVVVGKTLMPMLEAHRGKSVVVAASIGGVVRIDEDSPAWDPLLGLKSEKPREMIHVNVEKLDLTRKDFIPTTELHKSDSGRIVGPKAAQVGELTQRFPDHVSPALAIPFGVFRDALDKPVAPGKQSMFEWMRGQYAELAILKGVNPEKYAESVPKFLAFVRQWIQNVDLGPEFRDRLHQAMQARFGADGSYGVFVRSDTNIEDLPGFNGAGLNKTIPNVVKFDEVIKAIKEVWSSPFTERSYGWRQGLMDHPEHVYASVLLHKSVPNEKSGVMVTADIESGDPDYITVVTNIGVSGGVDGQAAETLRISLKTGEARLLASATARTKRVLLPQGGSSMVAAAAPDYVLTPPQIALLVTFARELPTKYPQLLDAEGHPVPADIEFGFVGDRLMLQQIRAFLQNQGAQQNKYLNKLDESLRQQGDKMVDLRQIPPGTAP